MKTYILITAVTAFTYQTALNLLESTKSIKYNEQGVFGYILDAIWSSNLENTKEQVFDWMAFIDRRDEFQGPPDVPVGIEDLKQDYTSWLPQDVPKKAQAMLILLNCADFDDDCLKLHADISLYGFYGIMQNSTEAFKCYMQLSDKGSAVGHRQVATMLAAGVGTTRNYAKALTFMSFASLMGDVLADQTLAYWNFAGIGMPKSCESSFWHYKRAAEHGFWLPN